MIQVSRQLCTQHSIALLLLWACSALCAFGAETTANPLILSNKRITLITETLFRLEYAENQEFLDAPTMFARQRDSILRSGYTITPIDDGRQYEINTGKVRILIDNDNLPFGQINTWVFYQKDGKEKKITARNLHSKTKNLNLGGSLATLDGCTSEFPLQDGLLSNDGFYYLIDTGNDILVDDWLASRPRTHVQDQYCFVYGDDFHAPFRDLGVISGKVPMTRKYMHGIWYSRWYPYDDQYIKELIDGYNQNDFPLDILSMDMDWHLQDEAKVGIGHNMTKGWTGFTWNRQLISNPKALIQGLLRDSIYTTVNEHPHDGILPHEDCYADFMKAMAKVRPMGEDLGEPTLLFDPSSREYMKNYFHFTRRENRDYGVAFWWIDWQQDYLYPYVRGTHTRTLPWINKLFYEDTARDNLRGANYSRWGGWGDHRHPLYFSGDARSNWDVLRFEVKLSATGGNQGCYYWIHDTGGFHGGTQPELLTRWSQFSALTASLRVHAARGADLDRRPWLWGEQSTKALRTAYHFRSQLMPYIYTSIRTTHETMLPLNRCMFVDYPTDRNAYNRYGQFLFGDLLLASPITHPGEGPDLIATQEVWFPKGDTWYDLFTDECHQGGTIDSISKDINTFPVFVKGGWLLPMQPYTRRPGTAQTETLVLRLYPGTPDSDNTFTLYEDDGVSMDYASGHYAKTRLRYNAMRHEVTIYPTEGTYRNQPQKRSYRLELCRPGTDRQYITIPARDIRKKTTIRLRNF